MTKCATVHSSIFRTRKHCTHTYTYQGFAGDLRGARRQLRLSIIDIETRTVAVDSPSFFSPNSTNIFVNFLARKRLRTLSRLSRLEDRSSRLHGLSYFSEINSGRIHSRMSAGVNLIFRFEGWGCCGLIGWTSRETFFEIL